MQNPKSSVLYTEQKPDVFLISPVNHITEQYFFYLSKSLTAEIAHARIYTYTLCSHALTSLSKLQIVHIVDQCVKSKQYRKYFRKQNACERQQQRVR